VKPSPKTKEAISEATGTRDKQIQQHLLQEPQHADNGKKKMLLENNIRLGLLITVDRVLLISLVKPDLMVFSYGFWSTKTKTKRHTIYQQFFGRRVTHRASLSFILSFRPFARRATRSQFKV